MEFVEMAATEEPLAPIAAGTTPRKIAMIGTSLSRVAAPYADPSWEIWGVSARGDTVTRANRWFEMHSFRAEAEDWTNRWCKELRETVTRDCDLYMLFPRSDCGPRVKQYPDKRITDRFGSYFKTSTFAWMMALAIDEMAPAGQMALAGSTIAIFGVEMEYGTEYREQRAGFRHYIALAQQLGIKVLRLAQGGLIYEPVPYPLWQDDPLLCKIHLRMQQNKRALEKADNHRLRTQTMIAQVRAVREEVEKFKDGYDVAAKLEKLKSEEQSLLEISANLSRDIVHLQGAHEEQAWTKDYLTP